MIPISVVVREEAHSSKTCVVCGGAIEWKRWLRQNWETLLYCGAVCRRKAVAARREREFTTEAQRHREAFGKNT